MEFGRRPSDPAARRPMQAVEPEPPATLDEELLGAEITSVLATETDETRVARMSAELRASFETMSQVDCGVSLLGSARTPTSHGDYALARETARRLGTAGFQIITGGGPGIMQAGNQGAQDAGALSIGLDIDLPFETGINPYVDLHVPFHYFFTRKISFVRYSAAFVVLPGGVGTLDELFEALTLIQTRKVRYFPIVLMRTDYWAGLLGWLRDTVLAEGKIGSEDMALLRLTDDPDEVVEIVSAAAELQGWRSDRAN